MNRKREAVFMAIGVFAGLMLAGPAAQAAESLAARPSSQTFYVDGKQVQFEAYSIHGNNFVKLRDIGQAVDFGVSYDGTTNSVHIDPDAPYQEEVDQPDQTSPAPSTGLTEENVQAALWGLMEQYPNGAPYGAPYIPNDPLNRPFSNCDACAGWAMLCSDAVFGDLPWRHTVNPRWEDIRIGDLIDWRTDSSGHVVVVMEKTDDYIMVTESGSNDKVRWGGQYYRNWLEKQLGYICYTRYPEN